MVMRNALLLCFILNILLISYLEAQTFCSDGYVVLNNGDTFFGKINDKTGLNISETPKRVRIITADGKKNKYGPGNIKAYSRIEIADYLVITDPYRGKVFARLVVDGHIQLLYVNRKHNRTHRIAAYEDIHFNIRRSKSKDFFYLRQSQTGLVTKVHRIGFREQACQYFYECSELTEKIKANELGFEKLDDIVDEFNEWAGCLYE